MRLNQHLHSKERKKMISQIASSSSIIHPKLSINSTKLPSFGAFIGKRLNFEKRVNLKATVTVTVKAISSPFSNGPGSGSGSVTSSSSNGLYELTLKNVDLVLEEVRPYLIADGGNVDVVSVDHGVISLELQGACGSCASSTTTMKMGIERVLKEKFGDAVKDVKQVNGEPINETTVEGVNRHLDILRPAIKNYGGEVDVIAIEGGDCIVKYGGPDTIGSGIKAAIKEKFPEIVNVIFAK